MGETRIAARRFSMPWLVTGRRLDDDDDDRGGVQNSGVRQPVRRGPTALSGSVALEEPEEFDPVYAGSAVRRAWPR